jgi:predicted transcriptional regulator
MRPMAVKALDSLIALKLLNFMSHLRPSDRRVMALIIEHFNRGNSRCDPGLNRLATLLGISRRTVIRAVKRLENVGLVRKVRHGGTSHKNRYEPNWMRFAEFGRGWDQRLGRDRRARAAEMSPSNGHQSHSESDSRVLQTCRSNLHDSTYRDSRPRIKDSTPIPSSRNASQIESERRWSADLHQHFKSMPITYGEIIERIDPATQAAATNAELKRRGAGIEYIFRHFKLGSPKGLANG